MRYTKENFKDLFIKLVKIDSCFGHEEKMADFVIKKLKKLDLLIKKDKFGNILARSKNFDKKKSILICAHLDTIQSTKKTIPKIKNGTIRSDGKNILGADNKAAIAEIIYALEQCKNKTNVELLFTVQEENSLAGARNLNRKFIKSKRALVLDYSFPVGFIVLSAPTAMVIKIKIFGTESHGARVNLGINAINLTCECLNKFKIKKQKGLSYNVGLIKGGGAVNIVPKFAEIILAVRTDSEMKLDRFVKKIENHFKQIILSKKGRILLTKKKVGFAYSHKKGDKFVKKLVNNFKQLDIKVNFQKSLGLSDANILNHLGIKAIEIGYGPKNVHTNKESITVKQMTKMSNFLVKILSGK